MSTTCSKPIGGKLVPDFELCKKIPEGCFTYSALVYVKDAVTDVNGTVQGVAPIVIERSKLAEEGFIGPGVSAPTLQELLEDLARWEFCPHIGMVLVANGNVCGTVGADMKRLYFEGDNLMDTAMRLWLELKGVE